MSKVLYLIGSLRNPKIPELAKALRAEHPTVEVFDDWYAAGEKADDYWKTYEQERGRGYEEALGGYAARHVFDFDRHHLDRATHVLLVLPAGKSGHMEIMYAEYATKAETAILLDPEDVRWDVMYQFIPTILRDADAVAGWLAGSRSYGGKVGGSSDRTIPRAIQRAENSKNHNRRGVSSNGSIDITSYERDYDDYARAAMFAPRG